MTLKIPEKKKIIEMLSQRFVTSLILVKGKQIMYQGRRGGDRMVVCTPSSKVHSRGHGWFDLTTITLLDSGNLSVLAIPLEGGKLYIVNFKELRQLMTTDNMFTNAKEGDHWKFYVWDNFIEVRGNKQKFLVDTVLVTAS
jgi:hypothetical protein